MIDLPGMVSLGPFGENSGIEQLDQPPAAYLQLQDDGPLPEPLAVKIQHLLVLGNPLGAAVD